ncbi:uncharacterized protein PV09_01944 [Verruconis gallopava]|uniref:Uncharacterized protein n=1 Tax=Verruconis gallopava TaxID=253628 RepID=A0A0D2AJK1_9PEZI|nr:uncharacterized protein PV09_01944 [Verruconis gallopava]KIW07053.1 hypothetical protein PV09_01944 [Verruconis gallopava]
MGGKVFTDLRVPRLPHELYHHVRIHCQKALRDFYVDVLSPPEAPDKPDHGDIDFLVARPILSPIEPDDVASSFGALKHKRIPNSKTTHYAVPLPGREHEFAQVDVHVCSEGHFHWEAFLHAYGDMMQILGVLNRPIGLTANEKGLHIRVREIEAKNRKRAMVFLTSDPHVAMRFLRLDVDAYEAGFQSNEQIYRWCFQGELYSEPIMLATTSNDRSRLRKRDMFTTCLQDWLPAHRQELFPPTRRIWTRDEVRDKALEWFPDAQRKYEEAMGHNMLEEWQLGVLADMREKCLGELGEKAAREVIRGSKRFVDRADGAWRVNEAAPEENIGLVPVWMDHLQTEDDKARFLEWFKENWRDVKALETKRGKVAKDLRATAKSGRETILP